jgi:hypothetical protein
VPISRDARPASTARYDRRRRRAGDYESMQTHFTDYGAQAANLIAAASRGAPACSSGIEVSRVRSTDITHRKLNQ